VTLRPRTFFITGNFILLMNRSWNLLTSHFFQTDGSLIRLHDNPTCRPTANRQLHGHGDDVVYPFKDEAQSALYKDPVRTAQ
jgi:hypothetical protein